MGRRSGMMEEDGAATKPGGRARGGWAARKAGHSVSAVKSVRLIRF